MPALAPTGPYSMRMQAWDQDGGAVMCIDIWFKVVAAPSAAAAAAAAGEAPGAGGGWGWKGAGRLHAVSEWLQQPAGGGAPQL